MTPSPFFYRGWEAWGKDNFQSLKARFDAEFEPANRLKKNCVKECNKFKQQEFAKLSEDKKDKWSEVVRSEWEEAKRLIEEWGSMPRLLEPADAQKRGGRGNWDACYSPHWGARAQRQGQLNVISMHYGVDKQAVPKVWDHADKAGYKLVFVQLFYSYYTVSAPEEQWVHAMEKDSLQDDALHPMNSPSNTSQAPLLSSAPKASELELSAHTGRKHKQSVKGKYGRKSEKQKKQKKIHTFVVSDDDEDEDDEDNSDKDDNDNDDEEELDKEKAGNDDNNSGNDTPTVAAPDGCHLIQSAQLDQSIPHSPRPSWYTTIWPNENPHWSWPSSTIPTNDTSSSNSMAS
ncbi:uncharacterized protein LACBIDRAFT_334110 [Laccaria bicolor S238N-H82]|uniref:Predicted protein n=1 Tax=Laccaria bicolor (strain S238N-H82 / ATCC MYA-4686) TaxID=486041 RepID=B0DY42_LACBS|nr:uncharacterized protein LACBIDRAFT_334110 [Laccaria bicolor S238N-H82]EDR00498.1 predicted protein [Laccaria bicolor S238N-H82]|eukprot:XP_001888890.1 predicted protein [Laccaria bicolor S238N-H82]